MIPISSSVRVWIASGHCDMRKGMQGLALIVQEGLGRNPFQGDVFVFRGRNAQRPTFCIRFSFRDDRISVASAVWKRGAGFAVSARQEPDVHLYGQAARSIP
ncbi:IS66 family insertion sequence element accessory protein TnpB [Neorhizobium petrolearium]|uniref:IS66 family insertion sequence element accessory protein TnpB n=1 Tax=Neorhizobium TaxID=1525371 RepID=UPI001AE1DA0D|nr:IS66 family insertion sequence element accessory protein TnpB [Neorhizobium petrolearium]